MKSSRNWRGVTMGMVLVVFRAKKVVVAGDYDLRLGFDGAFEDAVVIGIGADGVEGGAGRDQGAHAPEHRQNLLEHGLGPLELFGEDAADFGLDGLGVKEFAASRFGELEDASGHAAEDQCRHDHVRVENDADHFLGARLEARSSWTRRSTSGSRMPWRSACERP